MSTGLSDQGDAAANDALTQAAMKAAQMVELPEGRSIQDVMSDPGALASMSQKLASVINSAMTTASLPPGVMRTVKALKNLQKSTTELEVGFYKEVQRLEAKYHKLYQPHYQRRADIVCGAYQPTDQECHWNDEEEEEDESEKKAIDEKGSQGAEGGEGIPEFWSTAFKNCELFSEFIKECDEEVLKHLVDVRIVYSHDDGLDFAIEYQFSQNEWFTDSVLTMTYHVKCEVDESDPWAFEGANIHACKGCTIHWNKGKDLTVRNVKKKSKSKGKGQAKSVTKQVPNETFFSMFSYNHNEKVAGLADEEELTAALMANYNLAEFIRDRLVPRAVLFFTGEAVEEDSDVEDCSYDEDYEDDDDEGGEDYNAERDVNAAKPECKQQ